MLKAPNEVLNDGVTTPPKARPTSRARPLQGIKLVIVDAADRTKVIEHDGVSNEPVLIEDKKEDEGRLIGAGIEPT